MVLSLLMARSVVAVLSLSLARSPLTELSYTMARSRGMVLSLLDGSLWSSEIFSRIGSLAVVGTHKWHGSLT